MNKDPRDNEPLYMPDDKVYIINGASIHEGIVIISSTNYIKDIITHTYRVAFRDNKTCSSVYAEPMVYASESDARDYLIDKEIEIINGYALVKYED